MTIEPGTVDEEFPDPYSRAKDQETIDLKGAETKITKPEVKATGPIAVNVKEAILVALENNRSLTVERFNPSINSTFEEDEG